MGSSVRHAASVGFQLIVNGLTQKRPPHRTMSSSFDPTSSNGDDDRVWDQAEALIDQVEQSARDAETHETDLYEQVVVGLRVTLGADLVQLSVVEQDASRELARSGNSVIHREDDDPIDRDPDPRILVRSESPTEATHLRLVLTFGEPLTLARHRPATQLCTALLDLSAGVYRRWLLRQVHHRVGDQRSRDQWMASLYHGLTLAETSAAITQAIAQEIEADRICLFAADISRCRLVGSYPGHAIDRRSNQVRAMEQLAQQCRRQGRPVQQPTTDEVGGETYFEPVFSSSTAGQTDTPTVPQDPVAVIAIQRFGGANASENEGSQENAPESSDRAPAFLSLVSSFDSVRQPVHQAVRHAIRVEASRHGFFAKHWANPTARRRSLILGTVALAALFLAALLPMDFLLSVQGRVVAATSQRVHSPADGVITEVFIHQGQQVSVGDPLFVVRDGPLELARQSVASEIATTQSQLVSLTSLRTTNRDPQSSAQEQVLRTQLTGLRQRLETIQAETESRTVRSRIDGMVDQWDVFDQLDGRPVVRGQYLFPIVAAEQGWHVEIDIPDQWVGYVDQASSTSEHLACELRLRSDPARKYQAKLNTIANHAHVTPSGESVVRAIAHWRPSEAQVDDPSVSLRSGATASVQLNCGKKPAYFVFFRGIVEWWRSQLWIG